MNKQLAFLLLGPVFLASCTQDAEEMLTSQVEINDNTPVAIRLGWGNTTLETKAGLEGTIPQTDSLGVFMLAIDKQPQNMLAPSPSWLESNGAWMDNQRAKIDAGGTISFYNHDFTADSTCYYPLDSYYKYNFFAYQPFSEDIIKDDNDCTVVFKDLYGTKDIIWGRSAVPTDEYANYAYSARYYLINRENPLIPVIHFEHKLMRLKFSLGGLNPTGNPGYNDYEKLTLLKLWIKNVPTEAQLDIVSGHFEADWGDTSILNNIYLCDADDQPFTPVTIQSTTPQSIGQPIMLPIPNGEEKFKLGMQFSCEGNDNTIYEVNVTLDKTGFVAGHGYNVKILVPGLDYIIPEPTVIDIVEEQE